MSVFPRLAPLSVASVAAIGLVAPVVVAPSAAAAPCSQTASAAAPNGVQPLPGAARPPVEHVPTGRMPRGAQNQAVPFGLGPLAPALDPTAAGALNSAPMQQQGAVLPLSRPRVGLDSRAGAFSDREGARFCFPVPCLAPLHCLLSGALGLVPLLTFAFYGPAPL